MHLTFIYLKKKGNFYFLKSFCCFFFSLKMPAIRKINRISSKYSALERRNNRCLKICLTNIFAPQIQLERISNAKIQFIQQFGVEHYLNVSAIYLDHCYLHEKHCPYEQVKLTKPNNNDLRVFFFCVFFSVCCPLSIFIDSIIFNVNIAL